MALAAHMMITQIAVLAGVLTHATIDQARAQGASDSDIARALARQASSNVAQMATDLRARVVSTDPAKLQEYAVKEVIATDPSAASAQERAILTAEAKARGMNFGDLMTVITSRAGALRLVALSIAAFEAEAKAALDNFDANGTDPLGDLDKLLASNEANANALMARIVAPETAPQSTPVKGS
jgi:hypothetical protein